MAVMEAELQKCESVDEVKALFKAALRKPKKSEAQIKSLIMELRQKLKVNLQNIGDAFNEVAATYEDADKLLEALKGYEFIGVQFKEIIEPAIKEFYKLGWDDGKDTLEAFAEKEIELDFPEFRASEWAKENAGELITKIDEATRDMIRDTIQSSLKLGESYVELQDRLMSNYGFSDSRAECIARTESGRNYNIGAVDAWKDSGECRAIWSEDGDGDEVCEPYAGVELTFEEALNNPISHPNCTREFFPILKEGE